MQTIQSLVTTILQHTCTQIELAEMLGCSQRHVSRMARGQTPGENYRSQLEGIVEQVLVKSTVLAPVVEATVIDRKAEWKEAHTTERASRIDFKETAKWWKEYALELKEAVKFLKALFPQRYKDLAFPDGYEPRGTHDEIFFIVRARMERVKAEHTRKQLALQTERGCEHVINDYILPQEQSIDGYRGHVTIKDLELRLLIVTKQDVTLLNQGKIIAHWIKTKNICSLCQLPLGDVSQGSYIGHVFAVLCHQCMQKFVDYVQPPRANGSVQMRVTPITPDVSPDIRSLPEPRDANQLPSIPEGMIISYQTEAQIMEAAFKELIIDVERNRM